MSTKIQAIRGMHDFLPQDTGLYRDFEKKLIDVLISYGYNEIRLPIIEETQLFKRAIGLVTDVVEKEMYSFYDRNGKNVTLRPEGTAGCVRACIEHSLFYRYEEQRLWYLGPMFRRERPQKGRFRQFHQLSVEAFGSFGPGIDAEIIMMTARFWKMLGINQHLTLELNSIGSVSSRSLYSKDLSNFLFQYMNVLDKDLCHRLRSNPIRILDSKDENIQELLLDAPVLNQYLGNECRVHFDSLCALLDDNGVVYTINPRLVRGLDYYNRTVFEWVSNDYLGAQKTVCAGGRYDGLVSELGGSSMPAIGCAIGLDRLFLLITAIHSKNPQAILFNIIDIYIAIFQSSDYRVAVLLSERIHDVLPSVRVRVNYSHGSCKIHYRKAYKCGARIVLVIGNAVSENHVVLKDLLIGTEEELLQSLVIDKLSFIFQKNNL